MMYGCSWMCMMFTTSQIQVRVGQTNQSTQRKLENRIARAGGWVYMYLPSIHFLAHFQIVPIKGKGSRQLGALMRCYAKINGGAYLSIISSIIITSLSSTQSAISNESLLLSVHLYIKNLPWRVYFSAFG